MKTMFRLATVFLLLVVAAIAREGDRGEIARTDQVSRNEHEDDPLNTSHSTVLDDIIVDFDAHLNDSSVKQAEHEGILKNLLRAARLKVEQAPATQSGNVYYNNQTATYEISFPRIYSSLNTADIPAFTGIYAAGPGTIAMYPSEYKVYTNEYNVSEYYGTNVTTISKVEYNHITNSYKTNLYTVVTNYPAPPEGWMFCDGSTLNVADYPELYAVLGTQYNSDPNLANSTTQFQLPDYRGMALVGKDGEGWPNQGGSAIRFDQAGFVNYGLMANTYDFRVGAWREAGVANETPFERNAVLMRPPLILVNYIIRVKANPIFGFSSVELHPSTNYNAYIENNTLHFWYKVGIGAAASKTTTRQVTKLEPNNGKEGQKLDGGWVTVKDATFVTAVASYAVKGPSDYRHKPLLDLFVKPPNGSAFKVAGTRQGNGTGSEEWATVSTVVPAGWSYEAALWRVGRGWTSSQTLSITETTLE